ncbi:glycine zipper domain-containing protein [Microvirga sp. VF16]|uniref:glycine zipper domain-containing protein n=1 Tax=Microvirga sp. VF16 TaxID=2807101 RepID=UPI00193E1350|nr:glycine zipper domain-containing protein [Microvirga sp. VF16]QRM28169.1 hypothetical protein JO965_18225 [Microvirga sp. VF16]
MRKFALGIATASLLIAPQLAAAQEGTAAGVATGAVTGAIIGGPVGAVVGAGVGGIAGGLAEQNAKIQTTPEVVVIPGPEATGSIRQRTCTVDAYGNQACMDVVR